MESLFTYRCESGEHVFLLALLWRHKVSTILSPKRLNSVNNVYKYICVHIYTHIYGHRLTYIYIYIYIYMSFWKVFSSLSSPAWLSPAKCQGWSTTDLFLTNLRDLILWKCSYGPWDHFMFSARNLIWLGFTSQSPVEHRSLVYWLDGKFYHQQCGQRLLFFREGRSFFGERRWFCWRLPLRRYGGLDSANSANKVAR